MKIWVIGRGYPTPANKMWGSFELEQAKLLARDGHEVSYLALTLSFFNRKDPRGLRVFEDNGVKVYAWSHFYFPGKSGVYWEAFEDRCWRRLFEKAEADSDLPDLMHVHYPSMISSIHEIERLRIQGVKLYVTEHWSRVLIKKLKKHELARLYFYASHADCFACVSEALQDAVKKLVPVTVPTKVVPNIVSPLFFEAGKTIAVQGEGFTFISVGRLVPVKQFDVVIRTFLREFADNEKVRLRIVGSGPERKKLEMLAGSCPRISFTGEISLAETAKEIAKADALVSFSRYETFAAPIAEAWACGKPVIVSAESGIAPMVNPENGIVVRNDAENALGEAMKSLLQDDGFGSAEAIAAYAREYFDDRAVLKVLKEMYVN